MAFALPASVREFSLLRDHRELTNASMLHQGQDLRHGAVGQRVIGLDQHLRRVR
ncbi:MAG TPA: hypothetical protein VGE50_03505 [Gammaproteobacteria bacterium]